MRVSGDLLSGLVAAGSDRRAGHAVRSAGSVDDRRRHRTRSYRHRSPGRLATGVGPSRQQMALADRRPRRRPPRSIASRHDPGSHRRRPRASPWSVPMTLCRPASACAVHVVAALRRSLGADRGCPRGRSRRPTRSASRRHRSCPGLDVRRNGQGVTVRRRRRGARELTLPRRLAPGRGHPRCPRVVARGDARRCRRRSDPPRQLANGPRATSSAGSVRATVSDPERRPIRRTRPTRWSTPTGSTGLACGTSSAR